MAVCEHVVVRALGVAVAIPARDVDTAARLRRQWSRALTTGAADVTLVPSRSESFGLVAAEAAACGTPVIASKVGGLRSLVSDGVTGFLLDERSATAWAERIDVLLGDPLLAKSMSEAAAIAGRGYSWPVAAARLRRIYSDFAAASVLVSCGAP